MEKLINHLAKIIVEDMEVQSNEQNHEDGVIFSYSGQRCAKIILTAITASGHTVLRYNGLAIADIFCKHGIDGDRPFQIWAELVEAMRV